MTICAWTVLGLLAASLISTPSTWGMKREPYGSSTFYSLLIETGLLLPLIGRVLGWW